MANGVGEGGRSVRPEKRKQEGRKETRKKRLKIPVGRLQRGLEGHRELEQFYRVNCIGV